MSAEEDVEDPKENLRSLLNQQQVANFIQNLPNPRENQMTPFHSSVMKDDHNFNEPMILLNAVPCSPPYSMSDPLSDPMYFEDDRKEEKLIPELLPVKVDTPPSTPSIKDEAPMLEPVDLKPLVNFEMKFEALPQSAVLESPETSDDSVNCKPGFGPEMGANLIGCKPHLGISLQPSTSSFIQCRFDYVKLRKSGTFKIQSKEKSNVVPEAVCTNKRAIEVKRSYKQAASPPLEGRKKLKVLVKRLEDWYDGELIVPNPDREGFIDLNNKKLPETYSIKIAAIASLNGTASRRVAKKGTGNKMKQVKIPGPMNGDILKSNQWVVKNVERPVTPVVVKSELLSCPLCHLDGFTKGHLDFHVKTHLNRAKEKMKASQSPIKSSKVKQKPQAETQHSSPCPGYFEGATAFKCEMCGVSFKTNFTAFKTHLLKIHRIRCLEKRGCCRYVCDLCGFRYRADYSFHHHLVNNHLSELSRTGRSFHVIFVDPADPDKNLPPNQPKPWCVPNLKTNTATSYTCKICQKIFSSKIQVQGHFFRMHCSST